MNLFAKSAVSLLVFLCVQVSAFTAFAAEPDIAHCPLWEFETPSNYLTGEFVGVTTNFLGNGGVFFDLDTSDTVQVPGVAVTTPGSPTILWGDPLPASILSDQFSVVKTEDNPATTQINESDSWVMTQQYYNFTFTVLTAFYFEAEMQGYAYHLVPANPPATQAVRTCSLYHRDKREPDQLVS